MPPPDDLPRSPSGRVPLWIIDEAAGRSTPPAGWPSPDPVAVVAPARRHRRSRRAVTGLMVVAALGCGWWLTSGGSLPADLGSALPTFSGATIATPVPPPSAQVAALADAAHLSAEGRRLFYATRPEILDAAGFAGRCEDGPAASPAAPGSAVGCYHQGTDTIVVYAPADPRLAGFTAETVAHETLHAGWVRLSAEQQGELGLLLEAEVATLAPDAELLEQVSASVGAHPQSRATELFAYVGTQLWRQGGLAPALEKAYAGFIDDRAALVAVHTSSVAMLEGLGADITSASEALAARELTNAQVRAQLEGDSASVEYYRESYQAKVAEVAAMAADERRWLELSWVWWDGTDLPMAPADTTLAVAGALLARDDVNLPERQVALVDAEITAAAERARIEALIADLNALQAQLDPSAAG